MAADDNSDTRAEVSSSDAQLRSQVAYNQGYHLAEQGDWEKAIAAYRQALALNPQLSWAHHGMGDSYKHLGDYPQAIAAYRRAIALKSDFVWSHYSLAECLEYLGQWEDSMRSYQKAQAIDADNKEIPPRLARVLRQVLKLAPRDVTLYKSLATQLAAQDKIEEAIAAYQMALQVQPDDANLAIALSQMLSDIDPYQAHALLDRALSVLVTPKDVHTLNDLSDPQMVAALLKYTNLFDARYYRARHPELAELTNDDLLNHYITEGSITEDGAAGNSPNPLFDGRHYRAQHPDLASAQVNLLAHYHCFGYRQGSDPHPLFSADWYYQLHPDVAAAGINPLDHYLSTGAKEGRAAFSAARFAHLLEGDSPTGEEYLRAWQENGGIDQPAQTLGVYCSSVGNYFITEIADFIADALAAAGHAAIRLSDQDTPPDNLDGHWVVAPHEFFYLGDGGRWAQQQQWLENAVMVNVEQPQTTWFSKAFHFLRHTKIIFDINVKSAAIMQSLGLPAYWLPLGNIANYPPMSATKQLPDLLSMRSLSRSERTTLLPIDAPLSERPLDIHFIGTLNLRREAFFAKSARWLSDYRCFLHMPPMGMPLQKGQDQALDTEAVVGISRRSKILLNVHRDPLPYFEWHRIVFHGLWQSTLVVTESCHDIPGLVAGEHFVACELEEMEEKIRWLLRSPDGQAKAEQIRRAGHEALISQFHGGAILSNALRLATRALGSPRALSSSVV